MNVWIVYASDGAYSSSSTWVAAVCSSREAADACAAALEATAKGRGHNHRSGDICYGTHYESSGVDFWVVDGLAPNAESMNEKEG